MVRLKKGQEEFTVMSGPDEGKTFRKDTEYKAPPKGYENRFEPVKLAPPAKPKVKERSAK